MQDVKEIEEQRAVANEFLEKWQILVRDLLVAKNISSHSAKIKLVYNKFFDILKNQSEYYKNSKIISLLDKINQSRVYLNSNVNSKIVLENFILEL